ncbi:MAG: acyltransferase family protein [Legionellales bacterium]|nr:acyltransferase family protein [Legionellales bacterium]
MQESERLMFAHFLRGLAALLVVCWHFGVIFWAAPPSASSGLLTIPPQHFNLNPVYLKIAAFLFSYIDLGALGVALFFLISGFVIAASLDKSSLISFIIGRIFRIYPTYIVGFSFSLLAVF